LLFVPVSGPFGMGEYARSLAIARAASLRWPQADIHFVLSREAPYSSSVPFPATLLASSPTFHSAAVVQLIDEQRPDVVIFDNAGRTPQLRAASRRGARVVYISARSRQRRKAFRWRWMRLIDEHWIAYPEFIAGGLGFLERFKLNRLGRPVLRYLDVILSRASPAQRDSILARVCHQPQSFVLMVPGGGTGHPRARDASNTFLAAANALAGSGVPTVFVGPVDLQADSSRPDGSQLRCFDSLPQSDLVELMRSARLVVANGGSTLLQAIACAAPCIAVPIAGDQSERIRRCVNADVAVAGDLDAASMTQMVLELLRDDARRAALARRAADLALADGVEIALDALTRLIKSK
jgi:glycosyltransferase involved in cell wall biosynthesis